MLERDLDVLAVALELCPERGAAGDDVGQRFRFITQRCDERLVLVVVAPELKRSARELAPLQRKCAIVQNFSRFANETPNK